MRIPVHKVHRWDEADTFLKETVARDPRLAARMLAIVLADRSLDTRSHIISWVRQNKFTDAVPVLVGRLNDPDYVQAANS